VKLVSIYLLTIIANVCRERCGGQAFLSINIIEQIVGGAHAGITAEGDSAVLMQKVSNEYVADFAKGIVQAPVGKFVKEQLSKKDCVCDIDSLMSLMAFRESELLNELTVKTITKPEKKQIYTTWMLEESDLIQELAYAFGERICLEESVRKAGGQKY
jgi:acyl-CoA oxidase